MARFSSADAKALGIDIGDEPVVKRPKYGTSMITLRTWNGKLYDSRAECEYAQLLQIRLDAGDLVEVVEQPRIRLGADTVYVPDFLVIAKDKQWYVDVKGFETDNFKQKKKLWRKYGNLPLHMVKKVRLQFTTVEVIERET